MSADIAYKAAFQATPLPMILLAADAPFFTALDVNKAYCQLMHCTAQEVIGKRIESIPILPSTGSYDDELVRLTDALQLAKDSNSPQTLLDTPGGNAKEHSWNIVLTPVMGQDSAVAIIIMSLESADAEVALHRTQSEARRDLAGAQNAVTLVKEGAQLLEAIVDTVQAGVFLFTPVYDAAGAIYDFRFRMTNKMLAAYVGHTSEDLTGALGSEWFPGYKTNGLFERYKATALSGVTDRFEFHYNEDGIDVWLDIMSTKVGEDVLVTFTDYTSLKNLQRRLEGHLEQLRASNANLEQFAYIASHDLQEPLRKIKSFGDILQSRYESVIDTSGRDLIARMQSAAERMGTLINDLLTYSRLSVKPANLELVDMNKVLDGVLFDLEQTVRQKAAAIRSAPLAPARGQATQLGQVLLNILSNALKFQHSERKPEISIVSDETEGGISGTPVREEDQQRRFQRIRISDNGIGFEPAYREKIFQIFQRLHSRIDYPGSGVGLSIVQKVIENHHGYIAADAIPGEGATFTILLPAV